MNQQKFEEFSKAYRAGLAEAVEMFPEKYAYPLSRVDVFATKILSSIAENPRGVVYTNSVGFKKTCLKLGIKYTQKSIFEYLEV